MFLRCAPGLLRRVVSVLSALLIASVIVSLFGPGWRSYPSALPGWGATTGPPPSPSLPLSPPPLVIPELEAAINSAPEPDEYCTKRFTSAYLDDLRDHAIQYCTPDSRASLTCFHAHAREDGRADSFCLGANATFDAKAGRFVMGCQIRKPDAGETARGIVPFASIAPYWFDTGARRIFDRFVLFVAGPSAPRAPDKDAPDQDTRFLLLVKREGNNNLWHSLLEIWSMSMSFDVLRLSGDPSQGGAPYYRFPEDAERTQVVVVDDDEREESTFDLWRLFSRHPTLRFKDLKQDPSLVPGLSNGRVHIVLPLAGGSNPLWQNDWRVRGCREAPLLRLMIQRVFAHFDVPYRMGPRPTAADADDNDNDPDMVVTVIDRRGTRKLLGQEKLVARLQEAYPRVQVQLVDLAEMPLPDQLRLMQETDVLVGVHGAGLTHTMFMREDAGAVVEIQPAKLNYKGFRNLAAIQGQRYFTAQAEIVLPGEEAEGGENEEEGTTVTKRDKDKPWQSSNVRIEEDRFLALVDAAIKSLYNVGYRNHDVI